MTPKHLSLLCRMLLGIIFLLACVHKILFPADFAEAVFFYQLLPHSMVNLTALALPWIELVVAPALFFSRRFRDAAAVIAIALLVVFNGAMVINIIRGLDISCGCFSTGDEAGGIDWMNIVRNTGYIVLAAFVLWAEKSPRAQGRRIG